MIGDGRLTCGGSLTVIVALSLALWCGAYLLWRVLE